MHGEGLDPFGTKCIPEVRTLASHQLMKSRRQRHMWVEFQQFGSLREVFSGYSSKTSISKLQFDQEWQTEEPLRRCATSQSVITVIIIVVIIEGRGYPKQRSMRIQRTPAFETLVSLARLSVPKKIINHVFGKLDKGELTLSSVFTKRENFLSFLIKEKLVRVNGLDKQI